MQLTDVIADNRIVTMAQLFARNVWTQYANYRCRDGLHGKKHAVRCCLWGGWDLLHPHSYQALRDFMTEHYDDSAEGWNDEDARTVGDIRTLVSSPAFLAFEASVQADWGTG